MGEQAERVSLTIDPELVTALDAVVEEWGYASRSKAFRDALRAFLADHQWDVDPDHHHHGSITIVYDHHARGVTDDLLEIQHEKGEVIVSTQHVHVDAHQCLETIVVNGPGAEIRELLAGIKAISGVEQVQFTLV